MMNQNEDKDKEQSMIKPQESYGEEDGEEKVSSQEIKMLIESIKQSSKNINHQEPPFYVNEWGKLYQKSLKLQLSYDFEKKSNTILQDQLKSKMNTIDILELQNAKLGKQVDELFSKKIVQMTNKLTIKTLEKVIFQLERQLKQQKRQQNALMESEMLLLLKLSKISSLHKI